MERALHRWMRRRLVAMALAASLPMLALSVWLAFESAILQRQTVEAGLEESVDLLAVTVENELNATIAALNALAASPALEGESLEPFYEQARRVRDFQPWYSVWLGDAKGRQLMSLVRPLGSELPSLADRGYFNEVLRTGRPAFSGPVAGRLTSGYHIAIAVPVIRGGEVRYVLAAGYKPEALSRILAARFGATEGGIAGLVDRDYVQLARSRDPGKWVGRRASPDYVATIRGRDRGVARTSTLEGEPVYAAFRRLPASGWTVGVGVSAREVEAPLRRWLWWTLALGALLVASALVAGSRLGRDVIARVGALARSVAELAGGRPIPRRAPGDMPEIAPLEDTLREAGEAIRERDRLAALELARQRDLAKHIAEHDEAQRRAISRELHDRAGQDLSALALTLRLVREELPPEALQQVGARLEDAAAKLSGVMRQVRQVIDELRPPALEEFGLAAALRAFATEVRQRAGTAVEVSASEEAAAMRLPGPVETALYRIVQEAVSNAVKHSGAGTIDVFLEIHEDRFFVSVSDDGAGFDPADAAPAGHGLRIMRERAEGIGASFEIHSAPGAGTQVRVSTPQGAPRPASGDL